jgi:two-component system chemotaxis response regulator CheY
MKKKILIVEDMEAVRNVIRNALIKNYDTITASNGQEALKILQDSPSSIDLVLSDYNMPDLNGMQLLQEIRKSKNPHIAGIPFIMLTSEDGVKDRKKAKDAGVTGWIKKPYKYDAFMTQIKYALSKNEND